MIVNVFKIFSPDSCLLFIEYFIGDISSSVITYQ